MKATFSQILFLFYALYILLLHTDNISCVIFPRRNGPPEKYCGPNLSGMLDTLCVEYSLPASEFKRSNSIGNEYLSTKNDGPFLTRGYTYSSLFRRVSRKEPFMAVVSAHYECCEKGCTIAELLQYCKISKYPTL